MFLLDESFYEFRQTDQKGRGVFCRKAVSAGVIIGDYTGTIVSYEEDDDSKGLYSMEYDDDLLILAQKDSLGIHLINHSCMPNCAIYPYADRGLFVTLRHIEVGEEFTVSYMIVPEWIETVYPCYCGTPLCRGYMTTTKHQSKAIDELSDLELHKYFPKVPLKKGDILGPLPTYPKLIEDKIF
jgi:SET domain-containing protein